jgi:YHS domain-containing protein
VPVKIDYDYYTNTARQYGVTRLPTTIVIAPNASGDVLAVVQGALPINEYLGRLDRVAADARRRNTGPFVQIPVAPAVGSAATNDPRQSAPTAPVVVANRPAAPMATVAPTAPEVVPPNDVAPPSPKARPSLGLDGYCPVQLVENGRWQKGDKAWGMIHRGRVYLFAGAEEQRRFQADPDRYAPVGSGNDVVLALEVGRMVPGFREHGAQYDGHVYLFASEETLAKFQANPRYYAQRALQAVRPATRTTTLR